MPLVDGQQAFLNGLPLTLTFSGKVHVAKPMDQIAIDKLFMSISTKSLIDGLWVGAGASSGEPAELLLKVCDALELIKTYDPIRYKRILLDVRKVWVTILPGPIGLYQPETESCQIDSRFATAHDPIFIASVIVHEATHARMKRLGYTEPLRTRIEKACRRQEYNFARKCAGGDVVQDWLNSFRIQQPEDYTYEAWAMRYQQGLEDAARDFGIPTWLMRALFRVRDLRAAFAKRSSSRCLTRKPR